jgi:hypothetical protein
MLPLELWHLVLELLNPAKLVAARLLLPHLIPLRRVIPDPGRAYVHAIDGSRLFRSSWRAHWVLTEFQLSREDLQLSGDTWCNTYGYEGLVTATRTTFSAVDITPAHMHWLHELPVTRDDIFLHYRGEAGRMCYSLFARAAAAENLEFLQYVHRSFSPTQAEVLESLAIWNCMWHQKLQVLDWLCETFELSPQQIQPQLVFLLKYETEFQIKEKLRHLQSRGYLLRKTVVDLFLRVMHIGNTSLLAQIKDVTQLTLADIGADPIDVDDFVTTLFFWGEQCTLGVWMKAAFGAATLIELVEMVNTSV